jgi:hypothetical protein
MISMTCNTSIKALALSSAAALAMISFASWADTADPFVGTWMLTSKSTCNPPPAPKSHTFRIAKVKGGAYHDTIDLVEGDGTKTHIEFITSRDGKFVPVTGSGYADSVSVTQVDPRTFKYVFKKARKPIESGTFIVSEDGKTMQGSLSGKDSQGAWTCNFVSDRQL